MHGSYVTANTRKSGSGSPTRLSDECCYILLTKSFNNSVSLDAPRNVSFVIVDKALFYLLTLSFTKLTSFYLSYSKAFVKELIKNAVL